MKYANARRAFFELSRQVRGSEFIDLATIGHNGDRYKFFRIDIKPRKKLVKICLAGAVHGDEIAGQKGLLKWISKPETIKKEAFYRLYPIVNPVGFEFWKRNNMRGFDLNRSFFAENAPTEIKVIRNDLKYQWFDAFISFHENWAEDNEDLYIFYHPNRESRKLGRHIVKSMKGFAKIDKRKNIDSWKAENGLIEADDDGSFEYFMGEKKAHASLCVEVPARLSMKRRAMIVEKIIENAEDYFY